MCDNTSILGDQKTMSSTISWLRFPLILGVVFIHSNRWWIEINANSSYGLKFYGLLQNLFSGMLPVVSVPTFFFISGYLFFFKLEELDKSTYIDKMKRRVNTLLIPYILWNLIAVLNLLFYTIRTQGFSFSEIINFNWLDAFIGMTPAHKADGTSVLGFALRQNKMFPADGPLWYIRDLMLWNLFIPVFYFLIKKTKYIFLSIMSIIWLFQIWPYTRLNLFGLYSFILGCYFGINKLSPIVRRGGVQRDSICSLFAAVDSNIFTSNRKQDGKLLSLMCIPTLRDLCCIQYR